MSNRFPDNNDNEHVEFIQEDGALCDHCVFKSKCHKYKAIMDTLEALERSMFERFTINLDTIAIITNCPTFVLDPMAGTDAITFTQEDDE